MSLNSTKPSFYLKPFVKQTLYLSVVREPIVSFQWVTLALVCEWAGKCWNGSWHYSAFPSLFRNMCLISFSKNILWESELGVLLVGSPDVLPVLCKT
jgi:hypothetical protein